ncbi:MAG: cytochrome D1 domain-containing protein [Polyangiaceae bacterium]
MRDPMKLLFAFAALFGLGCEAPAPIADSPPAASGPEVLLGAAGDPTNAPESEPKSATPELFGSLGTRVFVVERSSGTLAIYDYAERALAPHRIEGLADLQHATMTFSPNLRWGFLATRGGKLYRIDLTTDQVDAEVATSSNSIDNAISHDGKTIAVAEYVPGGVSIVDAESMQVRAHHEATVGGASSRVTGMVDAPGNRFVCVLIEGKEIWILDASKPDAPIIHRIPSGEGMPYDAMITPDGRYYVVGKLDAAKVAVLDLAHPESGVREVLLEDAEMFRKRNTPAKLPHMASWAVAGDNVFVPLVGEERLAVLDAKTFAYVTSVPLRGHPVYAVRAPSEREIWVSFSGEEDDPYIDVIDTSTLAVTHSINVGKRVYHFDFTPRGSYVVATANGADSLVLVDASTYEVVDRETLPSPSGVFGVWRAFRLGL